MLAGMPRIHAVQTLASPLRRAYDRVLSRGVDEAVANRSQFMWPWESVPKSIATGILDDETSPAVIERLQDLCCAGAANGSALC